MKRSTLLLVAIVILLTFIPDIVHSMSEDHLVRSLLLFAAAIACGCLLLLLAMGRYFSRRAQR